MITRKHHIVAAATIVVTACVIGAGFIFAFRQPVECGVESWWSKSAPRAIATNSQPPPKLRLLRKLGAPNEYYPVLNMVSGTWLLTWSPDGERLAAYVRNGAAIVVFSSDGKIRYEIPRQNMAPLNTADILGFLSGHSQLLTGPAASNSDPDNLHAVEDVAFSILNADDGDVIQNVIGWKPGRSHPENIAFKAAISPDQRFVAIVYNILHESADRRIGIYATDSWQRVAALSIGENKDSPRADTISFSRDGKMLAVAYSDRSGRNSSVDVFEANTWRLVQSITTFPEVTDQVLKTAAVRFNYDGSMIAVILRGAGGLSRYSGQIAEKDTPASWPKIVSQALRVFKISDGSRVATAGNFPSGSPAHKIDWSPISDVIAFLDMDGFLYFWRPTSGDPPHEECRMVRSTTAISFSPDGKTLSQGFADGINLYEILDNR